MASVQKSAEEYSLPVNGIIESKGSIFMKNQLICYSVGPLLYCPANSTNIVSSIVNEKLGKQLSLALCLEDTIRDDRVAEAEEILIASLHKLEQARAAGSFFIPRIFIRVRRDEQIASLLSRSGSAARLITGFILPKFSADNADAYIRAAVRANESSPEPVYIMPIFESPSIIHLKERADILYTMKEKLDRVSDLVLNVRVGGNDLCHRFGFRRHSNESIHSIRPVADILSDIVTVFGMDYVVSGPVWEYYNGENWDTGLRKELEEDRLCGFIGKTVIHPKQIDLVNAAYRVSRRDLEDAKSILNWDSGYHSLVSGSTAGERMNEFKTHSNWAAKILLLSQAYGVR